MNVQVTADTEIAQTQSSALGRAVGQEAIQALPLENRNYTQILSLSTGVVVALLQRQHLNRLLPNGTSQRRALSAQSPCLRNLNVGSDFLDNEPELE